MLEVRDLAKSFGAVKAVDGATFTAPDGAITTLLGANGSGKTTTLSMIMGLLKPDSGAALVDGAQVQDDPIEARRRLGWFPDAFGLYPRLTAREHIEYFGALHGLEGSRLSQAVDTIIAELDMAASRIAGQKASRPASGCRWRLPARWSTRRPT